VQNPVGKIYIDLLLTQLPLYGFIAGFAYATYSATRSRQYALALLLAAIVAFPFASYLYASVEGRVVAPHARRADVASWPRVSITHDNKPGAFLTTWGTDGYVPKTIVALGRFEKAYGLIADDWYSFERVPGAACAEVGNDERAVRRRNPREPNPCVLLTKIGRRDGRRLNMPEIAEPHLRLLADRDAPSHHEIDRTTFASSTLELRLVSKEGSQLVSFWEAPYFHVPVFPPLLSKDGWFRDWFAAEHTPRPDIIQLVLDALDGA
jgi:hypothetical protein